MKIWRSMVALSGLLTLACSTGESAPAPGFQTTEAVLGDLRITAEATGSVEPIRTVEVKSLAGGEILELMVDVGDIVQPGDLLARVDPRDVQNAYDQAQADLEVAEARLGISRAQLQRNEELLAAGVITQQEYEAASLDFATAQSNLVKARTNFDLAEIRLNDVTIRAPLAGTILTRTVEEGTVIQSASQNVSGGTTLFTMAALEAMRVRTMVDETDMGDLRSGMAANVTVEAYPGRVFSGTVEKIEPQAETVQNVTMFPVIVLLDNSSGLLKSGMNAEVEILIDEARDVILIPNNTVVTMQDAMPAAMALGLDPEAIDFGAMRRGGRGGPGGPGGPGAGAPEAPQAETSPPAAASEADASEPTDSGDAAPGDATAPGAAAPAREGGAVQMDSIRAQLERGEITPDSARALIMQMRSAGGAPAGQPVAGGSGEFRMRSGGEAGQGAMAGSGRGAARPALVFVVDAQGEVSPRVVRIGLNDWDNTQVVSGLDAGESIAVIGAAQLQAQQAEMIDRMRSRMGGGGAVIRMR
jgi:HlyD family secretion protein